MPTAHTIWDAYYSHFALGFNPNTAIGQAAELYMPGVPLAPEMDVTVNGRQYKYQRFAGGIIIAEVNNWTHIAYCQSEAALEAYPGNL